MLAQSDVYEILQPEPLMMNALVCLQKWASSVSQIINVDGTGSETGEEENYCPMIYSRVITMMYQLTSQICLQTLPCLLSLFLGAVEI